MSELVAKLENAKDSKVAKAIALAKKEAEANLKQLLALARTQSTANVDAQVRASCVCVFALLSLVRCLRCVWVCPPVLMCIRMCVFARISFACAPVFACACVCVCVRCCRVFACAASVSWNRVLPRQAALEAELARIGTERDAALARQELYTGADADDFELAFVNAEQSFIDGAGALEQRLM